MVLTAFNALWIDDTCPQPQDTDQWRWTCARSFHEAILKLELIEFDRVSFDYDLASFYGDREMTGYDIALWLVQRRVAGFHVPLVYDVHSAPQIEHQRIQGVIDMYLVPESFEYDR